MNYKIKFDIDDQVKDRFWRTWIVSGYYIWREWLKYEIEDRENTWYEYPKYLKEVTTIWIGL